MKNSNFYEYELNISDSRINYLDKIIKENPKMPTKKIEIINQLKSLYTIRRNYFKIKINNPKSKAPNVRSLDNEIRKLDDEFRDQKVSGMFTYQNKFVKLLTLLTQLLTKNNSKKLKDDKNQILKALYNSKQITKQIYNILINQYFIKMTRKEQNKILDDKIKANNAQYNVDRMNAEISAYSSGALHKCEYLTKKDLNYKPNAFEQAKFEYSPLGKVFIDGLNKTDKKEGLLKRLKNIESKSNSQLLALRDINRPVIRGSDEDDDDDDDINSEYKKISKDYKNNQIKYEEIK